MTRAGWDMVVGAGSTKIVAAAKEELLSWQQEIEQLEIPAVPYCSQFIGVSDGIACFGWG